MKTAILATILVVSALSFIGYNLSDDSGNQTFLQSSRSEGTLYDLQLCLNGCEKFNCQPDDKECIGDQNTYEIMVKYGKSCKEFKNYAETHKDDAPVPSSWYICQKESAPEYPSNQFQEKFNCIESCGYF